MSATAGVARASVIAAHAIHVAHRRRACRGGSPRAKTAEWDIKTEFNAWNAKGADRCGPPLAGSPFEQAPGERDRLEAVVHVELDRMGGHSETRHFFHLEPDIRIDRV